MIIPVPNSYRASASRLPKPNVNSCNEWSQPHALRPYSGTILLRSTAATTKLMRLLRCGGVFFRVGNERGEAGVSVKRLQVGVRIDADIAEYGKSVVNSLA